MPTSRHEPDPIASVALLDEPTRRRIYAFVTAQGSLLGRDDTAAAMGISRELAAFHLDRLAAGGLLEVAYRRRTGRTGPGAGRPAKLYRRAAGDVAVSLPPRAYVRAAAIFAAGLDGLAPSDAADAVAAAARADGRRQGREARRRAGPGSGPSRLRAALVDRLAASSFEPSVDPGDGSVRLSNCPYDALVADHRDRTCGMNLAWASGLAAELAAGLTPALEPIEGACCVVFRPIASEAQDLEG